MQHHLASQYELAWTVADLVMTHGTHDFQSDADGLKRVVWLCGIKIYIENNLPVRFVAPDLDLVLVSGPQTRPFSSILSGVAFREAHALLSSIYNLRFDRGDLDALRGWHRQLTGFVAATAARQAA